MPLSLSEIRLRQLERRLDEGEEWYRRMFPTTGKNPPRLPVWMSEMRVAIRALRNELDQ